MSVLFEKICIIGTGLIGSSLARNLREKGAVDRLTGVARSQENRDVMLANGIADEMHADARLAVQNADCVVLCVPVGSMAGMVEKIKPFLKKGVILTDVGSVKARVVQEILPLIDGTVEFVPAHPVAGTEKSGAANGFSSLFEGRYGIITPCGRAAPESVAKVRAMWELCGMKVEEMTPERHDTVMAVVSHLPHLIAYSIVATAADMEEETRAEVIRYCAGGFRDFTRIAGSDPIMWRDIFLNNSQAVLDVLQRFNEDLTLLQKAIRKGDGAFLEKVFTRTRAIRRDVIDAKQAQTENEKILLQKH